MKNLQTYIILVASGLGITGTLLCGLIGTPAISGSYNQVDEKSAGKLDLVVANTVKSEPDRKTKLDELPPPPQALAGFWEQSSENQLAAISDFQSESELNEELRYFLNKAILVKALDPTTRNNIANTLLNQLVIDENLPSFFMAMINDETESLHWKEYAIQHLAISLSKIRYPQSGINFLLRIVEQQDIHFQSTAILQLHRLEEQGVTTLDPQYNELLLKQAIGSDAISDTVQVTAIGILGERCELSARSSLLTLIFHKSPSVQRAAIAALGSIGTEEDLTVIQSFCQNSDVDIAAAAKSAHRRLEQTLIAKKTELNNTNKDEKIPLTPPSAF